MRNVMVNSCWERRDLNINGSWTRQAEGVGEAQAGLSRSSRS